MFKDSGKHHKKYLRSIHNVQNVFSRLCNTCGYAYGSHNGYNCPGIEFNYDPNYKPEFYKTINKLTKTI